MLIRNCLLAVVLVFSSLVVFADDGPQRGVLPDGTPFRTDAEGNQIVDYIAELENAIDNLNRRIYGLESELKDKAADSGERDEPSRTAKNSGRGEVEERDLPVAEVNDPAFYGHAPQPVVQTPPAVDNSASDNSSVTNISTQSALLEDERQRFNKEMNERRQQIEAERTALQTERDTLRREREGLRTAQYQLQGQSSKVATDQKKAQELLDLLAERDKELAERETEIETLRVKFQKAEEEIESIKTRLEVRDDEVARLSRELGSERSRVVSLEDTVKRQETVQREVREVSSSVPMASLSDRRVQAMESAKGMMRTEINQLKGLVGKRDSAYVKYKQNRSGSVTVKVSELRAQNGRHLNELASAIDDARRMTELSEVKRDMGQIRDKVRDDIAVLERMSRVK